MPRSIKKTTAKLLDISVVIAGHNRPHSLRETLKALREQTLPSSRYEVIVIGFHGTSLQEVAEENKKVAKHAFTYKEINTRGPDAKRNEGIRLAKGKFVAFTDDDVVPSPNWLEKILESFQNNPHVLGVEGYTDGDNTPLLSHATKNKQGGEYPTCNLAFKKDILIKINGFDEAYHFFREDTDIAYKVLQQGEIIFQPDVKVFHPTRSIQAKAFLNELGMTRGEIRLAKKFPLRYKQKYGFPGRGGWLQALLSWGIVYVTFCFITDSPSNWPFYAGGTLALLGAFRYHVSFRKRTFTSTEGISAWFYMLLRDLAYPFFFGYFWLTENPSLEETNAPQ